MGQVDVSFIIVNYNTGNLVIDCIRSIKQKISGMNYEIIVVDNASSDDSCRQIRGAFEDVFLIRNSRNMGFGAANNIGAGKASGRYLLMLNPDTVILSDVLKQMVGFMERPEHQDIAVCGGTLVDENGSLTVSSGDFPTVGKMILRSLPFLSKILDHQGWKGPEKTDEQGRYLVDFVSGADLFIRREAFEGAGGFDGEYFAYYEETDLSKRLSGKGYKSAIVREARILHLCGRSLKSLLKRKMIMYESSLRYLAKFHGDRFLFKVYCAVNEMKYRACFVFLGRGYSKEEREMLERMIEVSASYRGNHHQPIL